MKNYTEFVNENKIGKKLNLRQRFDDILYKFLVFLNEEGKDFEKVMDIIDEFIIFKNTSKENFKFIREKFYDFIKYSGLAVILLSPIPATSVILTGLISVCNKYNIPLFPSRLRKKKLEYENQKD